MASAFRQSFGSRSELALVVFMVAVLLVLFTPIPSGLLDFLLIANVSFGLLILLLTLYMDKPLGFSTFPTLLLIATLFRLSLNIAATRLILADADAGRVIESIGTYVVGGNYVIGLVVFFILIVVQYIVVTNGAQRVAEVAARFTLDSMPGKQMSIDADLNMGLIDEKEAQERRKNVEKEANFYGAMDGASKFVKGDAIAGIIIILIDIVGGLTIGVAQLGMSWGDAMHTYTLLTVGDGIVTQIPALVISTATGIIVTRAGTDTKFGSELSKQISRYPNTLVMVGIGLFVLLLLPGIPIFPVLLVLLIVMLSAYSAYNNKDFVEEEEDPVEETEEDDLYQQLIVEPIEILVGKEAIKSIGSNESLLMDKIKVFRDQFASDIGFVIPGVRVRDSDDLAAHAYQMKLHGARVAEGELYDDWHLVIGTSDKLQNIEGVATKEPTYGLPAVWVQNSKIDALDPQLTLVDPITVLITHFSEMMWRHAAELLTRQETELLLRRVKESDVSLYEELIPNLLSVSDVQKVLQCLLREKVSIRNILQIVEVLVDVSRVTKDSEDLAERVRVALGRTICEEYVTQNNELKVLTLDASIELGLQQGLRLHEGKASLIVDPAVNEQLIKALAKYCEKMMAQGLKPVLLCSPTLRRHIKRIVERVLAHLSVLSMAEVPTTTNVSSFGVVALENDNLLRNMMRAERPSEREKEGVRNG